MTDLKKLIAILVALVLVTYTGWSEPTNTQPQEIMNIVQKNLNIRDISKNIWEDYIDGALLKEIKQFQHDNPVPFEQIKQGATWVSLKKSLDTNMVKPIPGTNYSWEKFRDMDKAFNESIVNKALQQLGMEPVKWAAEGTPGYNSDIDNVAMGTSSYQDILAKILSDTLHIYMYGETSDVVFDEQIYTHHPGATLQTMRNISTKEALEKYQKVAFSLAQLQIYRNLKHSKTLPWDLYKKEFIQIFPNVANVLDSVQEYDQELEKATAQDRETIKQKLGLKVPPTLHEINALIDLKAITVLSQQIHSHVTRARQLSESILRQNQKLKQQNPPDEDLKSVIEAATKEKEDLLIQTALLFALCETYFPEGYYTQEAFQLVVLGDQPISQMLNNMVTAYMKNGNPEQLKTVEELRAQLVKDHRNELFEVSPFAHLMALGEQLGYFVHKIESNQEQTSKTFFKGAKYLYRFAFSLQKLLDYFKQNQVTLPAALSQELASQLTHIADALYVFSRSKIYISKERLEKDLNKFIQHVSGKEQAQVAKTAADYVMNKASVEVLTPEQRAQALVDVFSHDSKLHKALRAKVTPAGIVTSNESLTLDLTALLSKTRAESEIIQKNYDQELSRAFVDLQLTDSSVLESLFKKMVKAYMLATKLFFSLPGQQFNPYSLNYNEIHLGHTYNPEALVSEGK